MEKFVDCFVYSISGDFSNINSDDTTKFKLLKEKIMKEDLILTFDKQVRFDIQMINGRTPKPEKKVIKKPQLISQDENTIIKFNDNNIEFWIKNINKNSSSTVLEEEKIKRYLRLISSIYNINCDRVVFDIDFIIKDFSTTLADKIYKLFLNPQIKEFACEGIKKWQVVLTKQEKLNILGLYSYIDMAIVRGSLEKEEQKYNDLILIHLNLRTDKNKNISISKSHIEAVFDEFIVKYKKIYCELEGQINESTEK